MYAEAYDGSGTTLSEGKTKEVQPGKKGCNPLQETWIEGDVGAQKMRGPLAETYPEKVSPSRA